MLRLIVDEFWRLQRERVGERELAGREGVPDRQLSADDRDAEPIAMQVLNVVFYGLPLNELQNFRERVNAVTVDDIQRVARAYLQARSAVGRAGRQRRGVRQAAARRRLRHVRADSACRPRLVRRRTCAAAPPRRPAAAGGVSGAGAANADTARTSRRRQGADRRAIAAKGGLGEAPGDQDHPRRERR